MKKKQENSEILDLAKRVDGFSVPEGYFDDFARKMIDTLPDRPDLERPSSIVAPRTIWQRIRPYTYMAAMFAGVWCMLKMFTIMSGNGGDSSAFDANPAIAEAMGNESFVNEYVIGDINQWDLYDDMYSDDVDPDELSESILNDSLYAPDYSDIDESTYNSNLPAHI